MTSLTDQSVPVKLSFKLPRKLHTALRQFEAAVGLNPYFGPAHAALAETHYAGGRYEDAWREVVAARAAHTEVDPELVSRLRPYVRR